MKLKLTEEQRKQVLSAYENKELIELEVFEPKPEKKIIDLSMVGSDIDMEFSDYDEWEYVSKLKEICIGDEYPYWEQFTDKYKQCRVRQDHPIANIWDECPLPEGLEISVAYKDVKNESPPITDYALITWPMVSYFKVLGTADTHRYGHELEKEE